MFVRLLKSGTLEMRCAFTMNPPTERRALMDAGVTINRPPRDGHMAFVRTPDGISIELLQDGHLPPQEPWASMPNTGVW